MKALVAGATGPVGHAVIARLLAEGHDVAIVTRRPFLAERLFGERIAIHEWHPVGEPLPDAAADGCDAILCLMGAPLVGSPSRDREAMAVATRVNAIRRIGKATTTDARLVIASLALAPAGTGPQFGEADARGAELAARDRLITTWEAEAEALHEAGRNVALVRLGLIAADTGILSELARLARLGIAPNLKGALVPAITLEDAATMLVGILQQRTIVGLVHGVAPAPAKGEAVMAALETLTPLPRPITLPRRLFRRRLGLVTGLLACQRQIVPDVLMQAGANFAVTDPTDRLTQTITSYAPHRTSHQPPPEPPSAPAVPLSGASPATDGEPVTLTHRP
jgi:NAD dependent epimerase/dehydratase family enzyme